MKDISKRAGRGILKSDKSPSQNRNPRLQIGMHERQAFLIDACTPLHVQFEVSDFGFEMGFCPISNSSS
jgi:hypothetical protein